ncbi:MAG TPA: serine/threonine-protein kinase [Pyrinomonadaceae bacterium]|nr:serine/threonine-protein kinase [Pyrinomonadaceae bacterium]
MQDRFLVEEQIGVGGMGAVYRAVDQKFGTNVAIKETFYDDVALTEAFEREARLLNGLHHPMFPHVSDHFIEGSGHFLIMEYIEGEDLSILLKRGERFALDTVMTWTFDLLDGLDYLHSQDPPIIHRDVKPSNLKLTNRGKLVLLDFGMARETSGSTQGIKSVFGYSRRYSPLEQIEGSGTDVRSDIFSLGATVYHLLTGTPPVDVLARASAIVAGRPDPLQLASVVDAAVSEPIAARIHTALALDPDRRFVSARAMWDAIEEAMKSASAAEANLQTSSRPKTITGNFPALEGVENDADIDPVPVFSDTPKTVGRTKRIEVPILSGGVATAEDVLVPRTAGGTPDRFEAQPQKAVDRRNFRSPVLWATVALLVVGLFAYALYQGAITSDDAADGVVSVESEPVQTEAIGSPDQASASNIDTPITESQATESDAADHETADGDTTTMSQQTQKTSNGSRASGPKRPSNELTSDDSVSRPAHSDIRASDGSRRPRVVGQEGVRQAPVSSIESILTGMPDRSRQQRQWELWHEEEELRRQRRIRRQIRRNQPF